MSGETGNGYCSCSHIPLISGEVASTASSPCSYGHSVPRMQIPLWSYSLQRSLWPILVRSVAVDDGAASGFPGGRNAGGRLGMPILMATAMAKRVMGSGVPLGRAGGGVKAGDSVGRDAKGAVKVDICGVKTGALAFKPVMKLFGSRRADAFMPEPPRPPLLF